MAITRPCRVAGRELREGDVLDIHVGQREVFLAAALSPDDAPAIAALIADGTARPLTIAPDEAVSRLRVLSSLVPPAGPLYPPPRLVRDSA